MQEVSCYTCNKVFNKNNNEVRRSPNHFCSKSCAAKTNNTLSPKRTKTKICINCNELIHAHKTFCKECSIKRTIKNCTIEEIRGASNYQKHSRIRALAREIFALSKRPLSCNFCNYDKHIEVCHIRALKDFPKSATLSTVNDIDNLIGLCPNCHWEFDNLPR